jgi:hypothetical protein
LTATPTATPTSALTCIPNAPGACFNCDTDICSAACGFHQVCSNSTTCDCLPATVGP